jgi:tetratricopeptide (TPR) repeat protein
VLPLLGKAADGAAELRTAAEIFARLLERAPHDRELRVLLADCYQSLGDLLGHSGLQNLGDRAGALESYVKAIAVFDAMAAEDPADQKARAGAAVMRTRVGDMQQAQGEVGAALENYRGALERAQSLAAADPKNDRFRRILALSHRKLADLESQQGEFGQALQNAHHAAEINRALAAADPDNAQASANFAESLTTLAHLLNKTGNPAGALERYRQANVILEKLSTAGPTNLFIRGQLADSLVATGALLAQHGRAAEGRLLTIRSVAIARELASRATATPDELSRYALILLTCQPAELRDPVGALRSAEEAVARSAGRDPKSLQILAQAYLGNGDPTRAAATQRRVASLTASPAN